MKIDTVEVFTFPVHNAAGRLANADALPVASVFEDDDDAAMDNPTVEQIGALTGWYRVIVDADSALYTVGKTYNVNVDLSVGGVNMGARVTQFLLGAATIDDVSTAIGTPLSLDGALATLCAMITKLADDNGGVDFDATSDSLHEIALSGGGGPTKEEIRQEMDANSTKLASIEQNTSDITALVLVR